jgi:chromosome segregation ATPase
MPRSKVRPPRRPRGESPKVTIANQAREIQTLLGRCEQLVAQRDSWEKSSNDNYMSGREWRKKADDADRALQDANTQNWRLLEANKDCTAELATLKTKFEGYRLGIRDALLPIEIADTKPITPGS